MDTNTRPNFTSGSNDSSSTPIDPVRAAELAEKRRTRPEQGAIWQRQSRSSGSSFLKIRLRLSRARLQEMLNSTPSVENPDEVSVEYVAFPNSFQEGNDRRPAYRVYEAQD